MFKIYSLRPVQPQISVQMAKPQKNLTIWLQKENG